jgi:hypothetical protein
MTSETQMRRSPDVISQQVDQTVVLMKPQTGQYYTLAETGGRIWELCDGANRVSDIVQAICAEYDAPLDLVEADVVEVLTDFAQEGLLVGGD